MEKRTPLLIAAVVGAGFIALILLVLGWGMSVNNNLVSMNEGVQEKWSQVENVYQRRADLIPNLVSTVKGYAKHESEVFEKVTQARAQVGQIKVNSPEDLKNYDQAQTGLSSALSRLMVVAERYPELKADRGFLELQSQLEGTENRITVERMRFNEAARGYNVYLKQFPQSLVAGFRNFHERAYFAADAGAKTAPKVEF
jgi:LemA protein